MLNNVALDEFVGKENDLLTLLWDAVGTAEDIRATGRFQYGPEKVLELMDELIERARKHDSEPAFTCDE